MLADRLLVRARLFAQRFWQPTSACVICMPGSVRMVLNLPHWEVAFRTGLLTGALVILVSLTPLNKVFKSRYGNALVVGSLTAIGDAYAHSNHYGTAHTEAVVTGITSGLLALGASYLLEDHARRLRTAWGLVVHRHPAS